LTCCCVTGREFQRHGPAMENSCLRGAFFVFFLWHHQPITTVIGDWLGRTSLKCPTSVTGVMWCVCDAMWLCAQNTLSERRRMLTDLLVQLLKERDQREAELRQRLVSTHRHVTFLYFVSHCCLEFYFHLVIMLMRALNHAISVNPQRKQL